MSTSDTAAKAGKLADEVQERLRDVSSDVRRGYERAASAARDSYQDAAEGVRRGYARASRQLRKVSQDAGDYVRDNPGKSILIAAGVGFLLGLLVQSRRRR